MRTIIVAAVGVGVGEGDGGATVGLGVAGASVEDGVGEGVGSAVGDEDGDDVGESGAVAAPETEGLGLAPGAPHAAIRTRTRSATNG